MSESVGLSVSGEEARLAGGGVFEVGFPLRFRCHPAGHLGALQVAMHAERDHAAAVADYKHALELGPQRDVRGLYAAAGAEFDPNPKTLGAAMDWVRERLA